MAITTFTQNLAYKERPFAGVEDWQGQDYAGIPSSTNRAQRLDYYIRLSWSQLEGSTQGNYTFGKIDTEFRRAMDRRQRISFGIMTTCPGGCDGFNGPVNYDGGSSIYPLYLHNLMQSETVKDWNQNSNWIPNWNSNHYLSRMEALLQALANYINTATYKPAWSATAIPYKNVLNYIDIRFMGSWGEWHHASIVDPVSNYPSGMRPTVATYKRIIDAHISAFPNNPLVMLMATLDAMFFNNTQVFNEVTWYALQASNTWGPLGIRRDQWGSSGWTSPDYYVHHYMENNNRSFGTSGPFKNTINERWKTSPILGEPEGPFSDIPQIIPEANAHRPVSIGNGNFASPAGDARMRELANLAGYKLVVESADVTTAGNTLNIAMKWKNAGLTPTYENWDVVFEIVSGTSVVWSGTSQFKPKRFLPSATATTVTDTFTVPLTAGNYSLKFTVKDPTGYRQPMPLFMNNQAADGSFGLGTVTIGTGTVNNPPTVTVAGGTITLPTSTFSLSATASDTDGTIASYSWSKVSGPTGGTITSPNSQSTTITGLTAGTHIYRVTVTDNGGASRTADATIVVNAAPVTSTVNAGLDQTITLPTSTISLVGSASSSGSFVTNWSRVSGSGTIVSPNSLTTSVTGLTAGTSIFRLTLTPATGTSISDDVTVIVNAQTTNNPPVANAWEDQFVVLPINSIILDGSHSTDPEGGVLKYFWRKMAGPSCTLSATTSPKCTVTNLQKGVYMFELRVVDDKNAVSIDTVGVVVMDAPIGTEKTIKSISQTVLYTDGTTKTDIIT